MLNFHLNEHLTLYKYYIANNVKFKKNYSTNS